MNTHRTSELLLKEHERTVTFCAHQPDNKHLYYILLCRLLRYYFLEFVWKFF